MVEIVFVDVFPQSFFGPVFTRLPIQIANPKPVVGDWLAEPRDRLNAVRVIPVSQEQVSFLVNRHLVVPFEHVLPEQGGVILLRHCFSSVQFGDGLFPRFPAVLIHGDSPPSRSCR